EKKEILGYLSGCINSLEFTKYSPHESYLLFSDLFENYNAHLHINCDPNSRGTGVGTKLINYYVDVLESYSDVKGVHIITGPKSRNVNFYQSNDFSFLEERVLNNYSYLFMGKAIFS
ncbi:MAG: GNAT family N-acetyltransferase, partial [Bdellovibrionales bacterium]|nr:GNAT family N-acetyltransferase [Bdellovibrionales bacterium]